MRSTRLRPRPSSTGFLGLPFDVHQSITLHLSGPKHLQQVLRLSINRLWTLTKAHTLLVITQAVRKRTWLRQLTLQRTTGTARCCPCPRQLPSPKTMFRKSISNPRCTKLSYVTVLPTSMKSWSINIPTVRKPRATHRTTATNQVCVGSEGIRTNRTRAI
jgi:hypothetical protein